MTVTADLPIATVGEVYEAHLMAEGGIEPYAWSVIKGMLPDGLHLNEVGTISGVPKTVQVSRFTIKVVDAGDAEVELSIRIAS